MGIFSRLTGRAAGPPAPEDGDDATLRALREAGANLTRETEALFYLYLPSEAHARSAAAVAAREGFAAEVREPVAGYADWLCLLTRQMVPSRAAIKATRARLEELAASLGGEFDGWEAAVTR